MRPELVNNPVFLRYYERWQTDPRSVVFAPISEMFRNHGLISEAIKIAEEGLKHHPNLISGRLVLAKAYLAGGEKGLAREQARLILEQMPNNEEARRILEAKAVELDHKPIVQSHHFDEDEITEDMPIDEVPMATVSDNELWHTATMARILASQGHIERARDIFRNILKREPDNDVIKAELNKL